MQYPGVDPAEIGLTPMDYADLPQIVRYPEPLAGMSEVRFILARDRERLRKWRKSDNKKLWERAVVILDNWDLTPQELSRKIERPVSAIQKWVSLFNEHSIEGIEQIRKKRDCTRSQERVALKTKRIIEILHDRPASFGINRSNWHTESLSKAYESKHGESIGASTIGRLLREAGYSIRKARRVLTSRDPDYREKVELLLRTLRSLKPGEMFFFIDELGPLRVKQYGGRAYVAKGEVPTVPDRQNHKGSVTLFGALSATTNQVTWFYGRSKDTQAMIDLVEILFNHYYRQSRLYVTWDAASWHSSEALTAWLDALNTETRELGKGPVIELVPLPRGSQFLDVIEAVFSGMKRAVIHYSDYASEHEMKCAISTHFQERNEHFKANPKRAGKKIWEVDFFADHENIRSGDYREW